MRGKYFAITKDKFTMYLRMGLLGIHLEGYIFKYELINLMYVWHENTSIGIKQKTRTRKGGAGFLFFMENRLN